MLEYQKVSYAIEIHARRKKTCLALSRGTVGVLDAGTFVDPILLVLRWRLGFKRCRAGRKQASMAVLSRSFHVRIHGSDECKPRGVLG